MLRVLYERGINPDLVVATSVGAINGAFISTRPQTVETTEELATIFLSSGPVVDAVMASAAIPAVLPPVPWGERELMDGGVANNTPISHAIDLGAREIYVLPTGHACALERPPRSALGMALHSLSLLTHSRMIADIELHQDRAKLIVLPPPCPHSVAPIDFGHAAELIERSALHARAFLDGGDSAGRPVPKRIHRNAPQAVRKRAGASQREHATA
jgi:NTE family protein